MIETCMTFQSKVKVTLNKTVPLKGYSFYHTEYTNIRMTLGDQSKHEWIIYKNSEKTVSSQMKLPQQSYLKCLFLQFLQYSLSQTVNLQMKIASNESLKSETFQEKK